MILLIDDDPSFAGDLASLLQPDFDLRWASSTGEGLRLIREAMPDHVLLDLNLPHAMASLDEEEGLELFRRLTPAERGRVVIVTGRPTPAVQEKLRGLGARRFYVKTEPLQRLEAMLPRMTRIAAPPHGRSDNRA